MEPIAFDSINNVRDLGGIAVEGGRVVKPGLLYRGGSMQNATAQDLDTMFGELGVRLVVDLRIGYERSAKPDPVVEGVENLWIPFYDNDVTGREYFKPVEGTIPIGHDFACDPNDFYRDMTNETTAAQMGKALHAALEAAAAGKPVYFHCSNGKDRAGVLALVILKMLGASDQAIEADYLLTNVWRDTQVERIYQRFLCLCQGDEAFARKITDGHAARAENLQAFCASAAERYGSMDAFIGDVLGFAPADQAALRNCLTT